MSLLIGQLNPLLLLKINMSLSPSQLLRTTYNYLNVAGVCPNSFDNNYISWKSKLYTGFLGVFPTYRFIFMLSIYYNFYQDIAAFLLVIGVLVEWISFLLAIVSPVLNPGLIVKFFQIVEEAQKIFIYLDITPTAHPSIKTQLWYISIFGILPSVGHILGCTTHTTLYMLASNILASTVHFATLVKLKQMLLILNSKFEALNNQFKKCSDESIGISSKKYFNVDQFMFKLHGIKYVKPTRSGSGITVDQILKFNKAHFLLCNVHKVLDSIFSLTTLYETLLVSLLLVRVFSSAYSELPLLAIFLFWSTTFLTLILFVSVLSSATDVKNKSQKTGYLVHELLSDDLPFEVEEELLLFSRSLCLRKIGLSTQGFFLIDLKLLTKMVCTLAPLVLILVQRRHRAIKKYKSESTALNIQI